MNRSKNLSELVSNVQASGRLVNENLISGQGYVHRRSPLPPNQHQPQSYETIGTASSSSFASSSANDEPSSADNNLMSYEDDDVQNLSQKFDQLQREVIVLTETQASQEDRYKRSKQENDSLLLRIHSLEDQIRELELSSESRAREDDKRFREQMAKQMKLHSQECEQHLHANFLLQQDIFKLRNDLLKSDAAIKALKKDKAELECELADKVGELASLDEAVHKLKLKVRQLKEEESVKSSLISILNEELESGSPQSNNGINGDVNPCNGRDNNNRSQHHIRDKYQLPTTGKRKQQHPHNGQSDTAEMDSKMSRAVEELESRLSTIKEENKALKEANEELQAQLLNIQLEEGRSLIQEGNKSYSLADELGDIDVGQLMKALKEQQEDNARLRKYMDVILLKIVEKNPELLDRTGN